MRSATIVVEVSCTAPRSDWLELSCLLCAFLRHYANGGRDGAHVGLSSLFAPGRCIPQTAWTLAEATIPAISSLLQRVVCSMRVCDMYGFYTPKGEPPEGRNAHSASERGFTAEMEEISFIPIIYTLHCGDVVNDPACDLLSGRGGVDDTNEDINSPQCYISLLPHESLDGLWESLYYGDSIEDSARFKIDLVEYVRTALTFSLAGVDPHAIVWNHLILLHGPPGTGKTSLSKALSQKLSIRLGHLFPHGTRLIEVNAHSLFSRWFSESGKQVMRLFSQIFHLASDDRGLVCVLIDEVESLAAARQSAMKGNEPSDSIRVVNTLLTQIDRLSRFRNVLVLATSNLTDAIDDAFLDRADKKIFLGPPGLKAGHAILYSGVMELMDKRLIQIGPDCEHQLKRWGDGGSIATIGLTPHYDEETLLPESAAVWLVRIADSCANFNGRQLRKLPFLAYATCVSAMQEYRTYYTSTSSLSLSQRHSTPQPILSPTSAVPRGGESSRFAQGSPRSPNRGPTEAAVEVEMNEERGARDFPPGLSESFPALPLSVFLDFLSKAAQKNS
ncbi:unnamed protein product [Phytomonas sp. Hart1]|nr:unnamed protein product [Phytomonas sp. Hart1]|eukprot:CCW68652.1 unnamed protein product [Phytomonas sp. isolate Hart1]